MYNHGTFTVDTTVLYKQIEVQISHTLDVHVHVTCQSHDIAAP